jgi:S-adenosylmethionine synthetase
VSEHPARILKYFSLVFLFQLTPRGIIDSLDLRRSIYRQTAAYGHFGRNEPEFSWARVDQAAMLARFEV